MKASPNPVQEAATRSSAQVPAPINGVSPTRPGRLWNVPPVEVAAGRVDLDFDGNLVISDSFNQRIRVVYR